MLFTEQILIKYVLLKLHPLETRKKSELQVGFEPTTLLDQVGCSNH